MSAFTSADPTVTVLAEDGETVLTSNDPWYRLLMAWADLYLAGEIDEHELMTSAVHYDARDFACPAARQVCVALTLAMYEPGCICIANWEGPPCVRECVPLDRRERLRELLGVERARLVVALEIEAKRSIVFPETTVICHDVERLVEKVARLERGEGDAEPKRARRSVAPVVPVHAEEDPYMADLLKSIGDRD